MSLRGERDMLTGMESAGREVAEYADRLKIAGAACEGAWGAIRNADTAAAVD